LGAWLDSIVIILAALSPQNCTAFSLAPQASRWNFCRLTRNSRKFNDEELAGAATQ
jgi:hypothetical protein